MLTGIEAAAKMSRKKIWLWWQKENLLAIVIDETRLWEL